jgi:hypothetical protein
MLTSQDNASRCSQLDYNDGRFSSGKVPKSADDNSTLSTLTAVALHTHLINQETIGRGTSPRSGRWVKKSNGRIVHEEKKKRESLFARATGPSEALMEVKRGRGTR